MRNYENAILATFLHNDEDKERINAFELNPIYFSTPLRKELVLSINNATKNKTSYHLVLDRLYNSIIATNNEDLAKDLIEIESVIPFVDFKFANEYYKELIKSYKIKVIRGTI